jgi:hypothetical protein
MVKHMVELRAAVREPSAAISTLPTEREIGLTFPTINFSD